MIPKFAFGFLNCYTFLMKCGDSLNGGRFAFVEDKGDIGGEGGIERTAVLAVRHLSEVVMPGTNYLMNGQSSTWV